MGLQEQAPLLERPHHVTDGCRGEVQGGPARHDLGADRLARLEVCPDDRLEHLGLALGNLARLEEMDVKRR